MPVFNGEAFLSRALDSILAQDFPDFELVISDNASTDGTAAICQRYARRDPRVRYFRSPANIGASPNHNRVFELASGEYFRWAAHDDECAPSLLRRCLETFQAAPANVVLVYPWSLIIDSAGQVLREYRKSIASADPRPHRRAAIVLSSVELGTPMYGLMRASALRKTRLIGPFHSSDYVLFTELAMLGEIREVPEPLFRKRFHAGRSTEAQSSIKAYRAWMSPARVCRRSLLPQQLKLAVEYVRSAWRLPIPIRDRITCSVSVLVAHYRRRNQGRVERWKRRLAALFRIRRDGVQAGSIVPW